MNNTESIQSPFIQQWFQNADSSRPLIIAGPCSAESPEQVHQMAQLVKSSGADIMRAGIWKPRSRPGSFQGIGITGLDWLRDAGVEAGIPVATEVATPEHVHQALEHKIDVLWIGARTTVNPFYVQEIAESLRGVDIPVLVKNPINPDLDLWIGALERFKQVGINNLAAIHRGFSMYKQDKYRNPPMWDIPIELKRRMPELPLICDPSHITGNSKLVPEISQRALDLAFNGLMIEVHNDPLHAQSDKDQQLTPTELNSLLKELVIRHSNNQDAEFVQILDQLRANIDALDHEIINLLAKRMENSHKIGQAKRDHGVTIFQMDRWAQIFENRINSSLDAGLTESFAKAYIQLLHQESIRKQTEVMNNKNSDD